MQYTVGLRCGIEPLTSCVTPRAVPSSLPPPAPCSHTVHCLFYFHLSHTLNALRSASTPAEASPVRHSLPTFESPRGRPHRPFQSHNSLPLPRLRSRSPDQWVGMCHMALSPGREHVSPHCPHALALGVRMLSSAGVGWGCRASQVSPPGFKVCLRTLVMRKCIARSSFYFWGASSQPKAQSPIRAPLAQ